jgi:ubiquinone biosynthesis protein Coq4
MKKNIGLRRRLVARLIGTSVPYLNWFRRPQPFPLELAELRGLPAGSLGAETAAFLDRRGFGFLPQYETHDVTHALLGYGTTTTGELRLQAFMCGNRSASLAGRLLLLLGALLLPELWPQLQEDYRRGRVARQLKPVNWVAAVQQEARALRWELGIVDS